MFCISSVIVKWYLVIKQKGRNTKKEVEYCKRI